MDLFWPLALFRYLHLGTLMVLFGSALFALYDASTIKESSRPAVTWVFTTIALISGLSWLALSVAEFTEDIGGIVSVPTWRLVLGTSFGSIWLARLSLLAVLLLVALLSPYLAPWAQAVAVASVSALLLVATAWLGHAAAGRGWQRGIGFVAYACHVLAAAAWLGGLLPLFQSLQRAIRQKTDFRAIRLTVARFSSVGMIAVSLIAASGIANAWLRLGAHAEPASASYTLLLGLKVVVFALALGLASVNRWINLARLESAAYGREPLHRLARLVVLEQLLGVTILALAIALSSISPH